MAQHHIVRAILTTLRALPGYPRLSVVDLSCGRGELISTLRADGCTVRGTHYRTDDYEANDRSKPSFLTADLSIDTGVDLTSALPYESGAFDVVILSEVMEHLPVYINVVFEAARILRPGGVLVLSTPNIARLHSRWHFFWTGTHKLIRERPGLDVTRDQLYAYHINPVDFPLLHTVLHQAGFAITKLRFTKFKWNHAWLLLLYPLVWLFTFLETRNESDLRRWMLKPAMLASEQLLLVATRNTRAAADSRRDSF